MVALAAHDAALDSPFFRPEFTQAVAAVRGDVEVAVLEENGEPAGFFPYQRGGWGGGRPVGGRLCDFQGVIARPGLVWRADELVRDCGLRAWDFDHLIASQSAFRLFHLGSGNSPYLDLSEGFAAYTAEHTRGHPKTASDTRRKARRLERDVGPLRLEFRTTDPQVFRTLLAWKTAQYRRTKVTNVFAFPWTVRLLERILGENGEAFAGVLSALYAGGRLATAALTLRSFGVLHGWFTAYDPDLYRYSPGLNMLTELAREAAARGVRRLDLGKGDADYKTHFMTGATPLAEGSVAVYPLVRVARAGWHRARAWARSSRFGGPARLAGRWTRSLRGWLAFQ